MTSVQLCADAKPCPYCGSGTAMMQRTDGALFFCANESALDQGGCAVRPRVLAPTPAAGLEVWNRRAGPNKLILAQAMNRLKKQARVVAQKDPGNEMVRDLATVFAYIASGK